MRGAGRGVRSAENATIGLVSVFKRQPASHVHIRVPVMIGVVGLLVVLLSSVCYYRVGTV